MEFGLFSNGHRPHTTAAQTFGDVQRVTEHLLQLYDETGGFGTLLLIAGKNWDTREHCARSYRRFIEQVAPSLADLVPGPPSQWERL